MHKLRTEHPPQSSTAAFFQCPDQSNLQKHKSTVPLAFQVLAFRRERGKSRRPSGQANPSPSPRSRLGQAGCGGCALLSSHSP